MFSFFLGLLIMLQATTYFEHQTYKNLKAQDKEIHIIIENSSLHF